MGALYLCAKFQAEQILFSITNLYSKINEMDVSCRTRTGWLYRVKVFKKVSHTYELYLKC